MKELTHISLFAGIGGIDLAAEWAGFRSILFVEIDSFCQKVLRKHWPGVPIIGDIRDATKEAIANATIQRPYNQENKQELEAERGNKLHIEQPRVDESREDRRPTLSPVALITGGFPCQPVSQAGKRRGKEDDRWLWPDMLRVISEVRPTWVVAENVTGLLTMGFYDCLSDLEGEGYETIPFVIPACGVNAPHRRDRIFIVAYDNTIGCNDGRLERQGIQRGQQAHYEDRTSREVMANTKGNRIRQELSQVANKLLSKDRTSQEFESSSGDVADSKGKGLEGADSKRSALSRGCPAEYSGGNWWAVEPELGRVAHGIPNRVDRLKCLGNAVVPQQIYPILKAIADIENDGSILSG